MFKNKDLLRWAKYVPNLVRKNLGLSNNSIFSNSDL